MGVGSLVALGMTSVVFFFIFEVLPEWTSHSRCRVTEWKGIPPSQLPLEVLRKEVLKEYPDDPDHILASYRAWDRHLLLMGMCPLFPTDLFDVKTIRVNPDGDRKYIVYGFDDRGHHRGWLQTLPQSKVQEAARSSHEEQWL